MREVPLQDLQAQPHVTHELPSGGVAEPPRSPQLLNFTHVVEHCTRDQPVAVEAWIVLDNRLREPTEADQVLEET